MNNSLIPFLSMLRNLAPEWKLRLKKMESMWSETTKVLRDWNRILPILRLALSILRAVKTLKRRNLEPSTTSGNLQRTTKHSSVPCLQSPKRDRNIRMKIHRSLRNLTKVKLCQLETRQCPWTSTDQPILWMIVRIKTIQCRLVIKILDLTLRWASLSQSPTSDNP